MSALLSIIEEMEILSTVNEEAWQILERKTGNDFLNEDWFAYRWLLRDTCQPIRYHPDNKCYYRLEQDGKWVEIEVPHIRCMYYKDLLMALYYMEDQASFLRHLLRLEIDSVDDLANDYTKKRVDLEQQIRAVSGITMLFGRYLHVSNIIYVLSDLESEPFMHLPGDAVLHERSPESVNISGWDEYHRMREFVTEFPVRK